MVLSQARRALLTSVAIAALGPPPAAFAQIPPGCTEICGVSCVKPIAIPDRWDDVTPIAGYNGGTGSGGKTLPNWANNAVWNQESCTDLNGNGIYDPGEPFIDGNGNGKFDAEAYDFVRLTEFGEVELAERDHTEVTAATSKIKARMAAETQRKELIVEGVSGIVEGLNPKLIRSKLDAYLQHLPVAKPRKQKEAEASAASETPAQAGI